MKKIYKKDDFLLKNLHKKNVFFSTLDGTLPVTLLTPIIGNRSAQLSHRFESIPIIYVGLFPVCCCKTRTLSKYRKGISLYKYVHLR